MKTNYEILGLPENAPLELVEKKYGALLRQYKQRVDEHGATYEDLEYYRTITGAYDEITGKNHSMDDDNPTSVIPYSVRKKLGKIGAWFDYYKLLIFIIIFAIVGVVIYFVQRDVKDDDIFVKFVGAYSSFNRDNLCEEVAEKSEVCEDPEINFFTVTTSTEYSSAKESETTQFLAQYRGGSIDVILIDKESFDVYMKDFVFMKLDDFIEENKDSRGFDNLKLYIYEAVGDGRTELPSGVYGIEISGSSFFDGMTLDWLYDEEKGQERTMILTIASRTKRADIAKDFAKELISYIE